MKKIYIICAVAFVVVAGLNVNIAYNSGKTAKMKWAGVVAMSNNEVPTIKYSYDASGNIISRELEMPPRGGAPDGSGSETESEIVDSGASLLKSGVSGAAGGSGVGAAGIAPEFDEVIPEIKVAIYPNPTQGMLHIDIDGVDIPHGAMIEIFASNGMLAGRWTGISPTHFVDISDKPAGMYLVRITMNEYVNTWKIVKN